MLAEAAPGSTAPRAPTIKDVAALARVGVKTVSRVLNDEPNVRPEMRARVIQAMESLDYRRNTIASRLRRLGQRTASIGLVVEDVANPFAAALTRVVQDYALQEQHLVLVGSSDGDLSRERELVAEFCSRRVDGLLIVPSGTDQSYLDAERHRGTPVVFVDRPGQRIEADAVVSENQQGVRAAVHHLAEHGHTRIAFLADRQSIYTAAERLAGYSASMQELGGETAVRTGLRESAIAYHAALDVLGQTPAPTALVCGNNVITAGAAHAIHRLDAQERVAVVGFDDLELADVVQPALTVVAQDVPALGRTAVDLLFQRMQQPTRPYQRVEVPVTLIVRGSGEISGQRSGPPARR